ncbi:MAG: 16S rRNA (adenine(1518)-N(6)/adenine(1519)-N(6))-dimethyltransferase RsmA [Holosporaceae bacterium]|jgi:16S rRNA (adenine1518-N6/adenine1519-N6)-dimethyltransferase|nr:16S rRNA (adenine(1518)-N(6)/adenine(1519)-N(6))-dimethyltransferase RsmA [Holosporaceae bacterium]
MNSDTPPFCSCEELSARKIFATYCFAVRRSFGQNFLFDEKINGRIVAAAGDLDGKIVAEIGPGPGGLTLEILKRNVKKLYLLELDRDWIDVWRSLEHLFHGRLEIIGADAVKFDMETISPDVIISNLPYNISTPLLFRWLPKFDAYEQLLLMFQKEVADRLYATPSTKAYGKLSVLTQWKSQVCKIFDLEPGSFFPPPKVKSTLVKFVPYGGDRLQSREKYHLFVELLTSAFAHRRKVVAKAFAEFLNDPTRMLMELGYDENVRAEQISVEDYVKILERIV